MCLYDEYKARNETPSSWTINNVVIIQSNPNNFMRTYFHIEINACEPNPCKNGGTCEVAEASFTCTCATGYTGDICDEGTCLSFIS